MNWDERFFVFNAKDYINWADMGTLTPTPVLLPDGTLRVYSGFRNDEGVSRIGFVDLDENNNFSVIKYSKTPALDLGSPGCFDDNGMLLGDFLWSGDDLLMYYVGFQIVQKAKFLAFTGLAKSSYPYENFVRAYEHPVLDRLSGARYINAIHGIIKPEDKDGYVCFCSEGNGWELIGDKPYPKYSIFTRFSADGINFNKESVALELFNHGEYRIGRSRPFKIKNGCYILTFTYGTKDGKYLSGYAKSVDMERWERMPELFIEPSGIGFDSKSAAYPALIYLKDGRLACFYNGDNMGERGIGVAIKNDFT